jgi:hypothetical protein
MTRCPESEVRLQQELRFTDDRRSPIGDDPVARSGSCAAKSSGYCPYHDLSHLLFFMRQSHAAVFLRANL